LAGSLAAWPFRSNFTGGLLFAACEAALVGALADWFAVVALFRHPLGLKFIPHTAIIPNNRERIIEGIVGIVEKDWLSLDFIKVKILEYPLIDSIANALETETGRQSLTRLAYSVVNNTIENLDPDDIARFLHVILADHVGDLKISPRLLEQVELSLKQLYSEDVIRLLLDWAISAAQGEDMNRAIKRTLTRAVADYSNQGNFFRRLGKGLGESLDILNYDEAAAALAARIRHFLVEVKDPANQYHLRIKHEMDNLHIADPDSASEAVNSILRKGLGTEARLKTTAELITEVKNQLLESDTEDSPFIKYLTMMIIEQIRSIQQDLPRKQVTEDWIKTELMQILERYHGVIGGIVREKLQSLNDAGLVESLEDKVGEDLQWIRINGTIIGALVGVLQYLILHLF
jgi:uncharacterized membrane-anchored protein YjiN (DUF445 family)